MRTIMKLETGNLKLGRARVRIDTITIIIMRTTIAG
jgi:hypothetical protein